MVELAKKYPGAVHALRGVKIRFSPAQISNKPLHHHYIRAAETLGL
jgi:hypothetical protein